MDAHKVAKMVDGRAQVGGGICIPQDGLKDLILSDRGWAVVDHQTGEVLAESASFETVSRLKDVIATHKATIGYLEEEVRGFERIVQQMKADRELYNTPLPFANME